MSEVIFKDYPTEFSDEFLLKDDPEDYNRPKAPRQRRPVRPEKEFFDKPTRDRGNVGRIKSLRKHRKPGRRNPLTRSGYNDPTMPDRREHLLLQAHMLEMKEEIPN